MAQMVGQDVNGNVLQFQADATPIEGDVITRVQASPFLSGVTPTGVPAAVVTAAANGSITALKLDAGTKTATAVSGAATLNKASGVVTSEALTTAAGATYTLTLTDSAIAATDIVMASVALTAAGGTPTIASVKPGTGSVTIIVQNIHATDAFAAAIKIAFAVFKA